MKDLYGKTHLNYGFSGLRTGFVRRIMELGSDVCNLRLAAAKRPVAVPAVLLSVCSILCYCFSSYVPALFMSGLVMAFSCFPAFFRGRRPENNVPVFAVALMICGALIYTGVFISTRLNASKGSDELKCVVSEVSRDLSGGSEMTVRLEGGALAKTSFSCSSDDISPGDVLLLSGKLKEPENAGNPGGFDYKDYLRKKGILYIVYCDKYEKLDESRFPLNITGYLQSLFFGIRENAFNAVTGAFDEESRAMTAAVCLGDRSLVSDSVSRDFEMSCCSHLLAVSGMHFSGFLVSLPALMKILRLKHKKAFAAQVFFCILTGCLTGWSDSVTRAAVMSICLFADREWVSALSLASVIMILSDPFCPLSSGFQMSFCAVIAIKVYSVRITGFLERFHLKGPLAKTLCPAVSAVLGLIPFWPDISMRPDPEHLVIQIAGSFIAGAACTFFIPCLILCRLLPFWNMYLSSPLLLCLNALEQLVAAGRALSERSGMSVHPGNIVLIVLGIAVFLYMIPPCMLRRVLLKPAALILAVVFGIEAVSIMNRPDCLVVFADVGQGDCCLIITPDTTCLIDAGTYEKGSSTVSSLLDYYGIYQADICIMSHWDADHAGGIAALCVQGRTDTILTSYLPYSGDSDKDVKEFFKAADMDDGERSVFFSQLQAVSAGERIYLSENVSIDVLYPSSGSGGGNESSLVLMLHAPEGTDILFTGDIGAGTEALLINENIDLDCDILKVAHHGSKYSSSMEFIEACSPEIAVISVGAHNLYGHPAPQTLERLESYGCDIFRTDTEGAVVLEYRL